MPYKRNKIRIQHYYNFDINNLNDKFYALGMAQQDRRIPDRPPATAPPPPRRLEAPQPEYLKPKTKPPKLVTHESIKSLKREL